MKGRESNIKVHLFCVLVLSLVLCSSTAFAAVIHVPGDYRTIQAAIDAASDGDTVVVADGTYGGRGNKNIDFNGKELTVQSQNGPEHCVIDCGGQGRGFYFHSGELEDAVVAGFTITNGRMSDYGGGIYIVGSSPTITHCIIVNNRVIGSSKKVTGTTGGHSSGGKVSSANALFGDGHVETRNNSQMEWRWRGTYYSFY